MNPVDFLVPIHIKGKSRIGNNYDGGYVIYNRLLNETDVLITYGIGWDTGFEEHFHKLTGKGALMFDPSLFHGIFLINFSYLAKSASRLELRIMLSYMSKAMGWWMKRKSLRKKEIHFIQEGIAAKKKPHFDTLTNHIKRYSLEDKNILLKIDIEGDEYDVFENEIIFSALKNINQIIIEWHDLKTRLRNLRAILSKLKNEFEIVHVHGNNWGAIFRLYESCNNKMKEILLPDVLEMTLVRRSSILPGDLLNDHIKYPVDGLDQPNNPRNYDLTLDFIDR